MTRALHTLAGFKEEIELHQATEVRATATSAVRAARNGPAFVAEIFAQTGIQVEVIPGDREAELITKGVRQAVPLGRQPHLLMDIGGGSVEFIIADEATIFWKQSFEIGAQRLLDQFFAADPMPPAAVQRRAGIPGRHPGPADGGRGRLSAGWVSGRLGHLRHAGRPAERPRRPAAHRHAARNRYSRGQLLRQLTTACLPSTTPAALPCPA